MADNVLGKYGPGLGPAANVLAPREGWERLDVLPFARQHAYNGEDIEAGPWQWGVPQMGADALNALGAVGGSPLIGRPYAPSSRPEMTQEMIGHAGVGTGMMMTGGIGRSIMAAPSIELGSSGGRLRGIVPSIWLPAPGKPRGVDLGVVPRYADVSRTKLTIDPDGHAYLDVPKIQNPEVWPGGRVPPPYDPGDRLFRYVDEFLWPFEEDTFIRSSIRPSDRAYLESGKHRGSKNHRTGESEGGLSVAHRVEPGDGYRNAYFVRGRIIGNGADGEPLLDVSSSRPFGKTYTIDEMEDILNAGIDRRVRELGFSDVDLRAMRNARTIRKD